MLRSESPVFREINHALNEISRGRFQIINGNYISQMSDNQTHINHCFFYLNDFETISTVNENEKPDNDQDMFGLNRCFIMNCKLKLRILGDPTEIIDFAHQVRSFLLHDEFSRTNMPSIVVGPVSESKISSLIIDNQMVSQVKFVIDCVVQDDSLMEVPTINTINKEFNIN